MKKSWMALCLVLALWASLLAGCNTPGQTLSGDAEYTVSVVGGDGQPYTTGVIVQILKDGEQVALQPINAEGKVSKTLPRADYTVELKFTDGDEGYYYDKTQLVLSAQQTTLEVKVFPTASGTPVKVYYNSEEYDAYNVNRGVSYVGLTDGQRNFFLFAAQTSGTYRFTTSDPHATIGSYGFIL